MGGAAGHLMHLHEDEDLTFLDIEKILSSASNGSLEGATEKLDGLNIMFSWDFNHEDIVIARSLGDIKNGGVKIQDISKRIGKIDDLCHVFKSSLESLNTAVSKINEYDKQKIFQKKSKVWYSAEIISSTRPNVVKYDENSIVFHEYPVLFLDEDNSVIHNNDNSGVNLICSRIEEMQREIEGSKWVLKRPSIVSLESKDDRKVLESTMEEISNLINGFGLSKSDTIREYVKKNVIIELISIGFQGETIDKISSRILKNPGAHDLRKLKKMFPDQQEKMDNVVKNGDRIVKKALAKIDKIISRFSMKVLEGVKSSFINDNEKEVKRLRGEAESIAKKIIESNDVHSINFINQQIEKIGTIENIKTAVEGVVFPYNGKMYKFTGAFAVANQIIGMYRYK